MSMISCIDSSALNLAWGTQVPAATTLARRDRSPMVWNIGMTPRDTAPVGWPVWIRWATAAECSALCVRGTPLGFPVVPEV
ncbi:hypothetical protein D9M69_722960 [compost metagenome]